MTTKIEKEIVYLKLSNGHQIWIRKGIKQGYKYFGIYTKPIYKDLTKKKEEKKNVNTTINS